MTFNDWLGNPSARTLDRAEVAAVNAVEAANTAHLVKTINESRVYRRKVLRPTNVDVKRRSVGGNGRLGRGGIIGSTVSQHTRRISGPAEDQAIGSMIGRDRALSELLADVVDGDIVSLAELF